MRSPKKDDWGCYPSHKRQLRTKWLSYCDSPFSALHTFPLQHQICAKFVVSTWQTKDRNTFTKGLCHVHKAYLAIDATRKDSSIDSKEIEVRLSWRGNTKPTSLLDSLLYSIMDITRVASSPVIVLEALYEYCTVLSELSALGVYLIKTPHQVEVATPRIQWVLNHSWSPHNYIKVWPQCGKHEMWNTMDVTPSSSRSSQLWLGD